MSKGKEVTKQTGSWNKVRIKDFKINNNKF